MFEQPITTQEQFDKLISYRLERERKKERRQQADELQIVIDICDSLLSVVTEMQRTLREP